MEPTISEPVETGQAEPFHIEVRPGTAGNLLVLSGLLDASAAVTLLGTARQLAAEPRDVAIDWAGAEHIGASALQVLLAMSSAISGSGKNISVAVDNPEVRDFLDLAGLSGHFPTGGGR